MRNCVSQHSASRRLALLNKLWQIRWDLPVLYRGPSVILQPEYENRSKCKLLAMANSLGRVHQSLRLLSAVEAGTKIKEMQSQTHDVPTVL
jgi:hypothetical protein